MDLAGYGKVLNLRGNNKIYWDFESVFNLARSCLNDQSARPYYLIGLDKKILAMFF